MEFRVGTSGWSYYNWKEIFYPKEIKSSDWLSFYSSVLNTVELNSSFYRLPTLKSLQSWFDKTSANFIFSLKAPRSITHYKKLIDCQEEVNLFFERIKILTNKCGPILFQLPSSFHKNKKRLEEFIKLLPTGYRYVFEFRHESWWEAEIIELLKANNICFCIFEIAKFASPKLISADFIYIRLHGNEEKPYRGRYSDAILKQWKNFILEHKKDTYLYFDNTMLKDDAIANAKFLNQALYLNHSCT